MSNRRIGFIITATGFQRYTTLPSKHHLDVRHLLLQRRNVNVQAAQHNAIGYINTITSIQVYFPNTSYSLYAAVVVDKTLSHAIALMLEQTTNVWAKPSHTG
jgi:hypothetical protein